MWAAGGAGVLVGPIYLALGLTGRGYVATTSATALVVHGGRIVGYGAAGLLTPSTLTRAATLAAAIILGNALGRELRAVTERAPPRLLETATLVVCVTLALAGIAP